MLNYKSDSLTVAHKTANRLVRALRGNTDFEFIISLAAGFPLVSAIIGVGTHTVHIGPRYVRDIAIADIIPTWRLYVDANRLRKKLDTIDTMFIRSKG